MFYTFMQNNSGGAFDRDDAVTDRIIIEADSHGRANIKAEEIGIYFDGVYKGYDCDCCGDRWYPVDESDATDEPEYYGMKFIESNSSYAYVYYIDGRKLAGEFVDA